MNDPKNEALLAELKSAAQIKSERRADLAAANAKLLEARARQRRTREAKAVGAAKELVMRCSTAFARACDSIEAVELELLTGDTGLPMFDHANANAAANGPSHVADASPDPAEVSEPSPAHREPPLRRRNGKAAASREEVAP